MKKIAISIALVTSLLGFSWAQAPTMATNLVWDAQVAHAAAIADDFAWD